MPEGGPSSAAQPPPAPGTLPVPPAPGPPLPAPGAPAASARPGHSSIAGIRKELEEDIQRIESENGEIDMLMEQVLIEVERHESRRSKMETQLAALETSASPDHAEISEVRTGLLALTRRELLFDAQRQVLEGKQRILARFLQRLVEIDNSLASMAGMPTRPTPVASPGLRPLATAAGGSDVLGSDQPAMAMRSEEDLRRDIVRQLHDGPAQSLANIGLQAEIVERLMDKGDTRASDEIEALRQLVQQALDTTKDFIFEIRPMVLDDLGLGPTIRRITSDRSRRSGINVDFDSQGIEDRLDRDIESAVFRSIDEAIVGYLALESPSVIVRLDWSERELAATVAGTWPSISAGGQAEPSVTTDSRSDETPPLLLAMMEEKRSADRQAVVESHSLPAEKLAEIGNRARALGLTLTIRDDGQVMELIAPVSRSTSP